MYHFREESLFYSEIILCGWHLPKSYSHSGDCQNHFLSAKLVSTIKLNCRNWRKHIFPRFQCDQIEQLFKACGNNHFAQIVSHFKPIVVKVSKSFIFLVNSFWATFIDIWLLFTGHAARFVRYCVSNKFAIYRQTVEPEMTNFSGQSNKRSTMENYDASVRLVNHL